MKAAAVGIAGLGGLGSAVAVALARMGVGRLVLVDFDVVEPSNLNRQQYFVDQLGQSKALALGENLKRINPYEDGAACGADYAGEYRFFLWRCGCWWRHLIAPIKRRC